MDEIIKHIHNNPRIKGYGIAGFTLSLIGLLIFILPYIGVILCIFGIVFSVKQRGIMKTRLSTAGLVIGIIGIITNIILLIVTILILTGVIPVDLSAIPKLS